MMPHSNGEISLDANLIQLMSVMFNCIREAKLNAIWYLDLIGVLFKFLLKHYNCMGAVMVIVCSIRY